MYTITGYEHIKSKEGQVFTKVYIAQPISDEKGFKPFPINFMVSGEVRDYVPGSTCDVVLDAKTDGQLFISGIRLSDDTPEPGTIIN